EVIVFEDESTTSAPIDGDKAVPYRYGGGLERTEDAIGWLEECERTASGKVTLRDYDFKKPELDLTVSASAAVDADLEVYDYPGLYVAPGDGKHLAEVRLEAMQAERAVVRARAGCVRLVPGRSFELSDAPNALDGEYFITESIHTLAKGTYVVHAAMVP